MKEKYMCIFVVRFLLQIRHTCPSLTRSNMSDDDDMVGNDDFELEYENTDEEPDADLENQYYNSKALKEDDPLAAIESFKKVLTLEQKSGDKGDWGFKALKQMMKIYFKMENYDDMLACYKEL